MKVKQTLLYSSIVGLLLGVLPLSNIHAAPSIYAGASVGSNYYDHSVVPDSIKIETKHLSYGALGGALWTNGVFKYGVELGFDQYGKKTWRNTEKEFTLQSNAVLLNGVLRYSPRSLRSLYFEVQTGIAYVTQKTTFKDLLANPALPGVDTQSGSIAGEKQNIEPDLVFGVGYNVLKQFTVALDYSRILAKNDSPSPFLNDGTGSFATQAEFNTVATIENISLRLIYNF